MEFTNNLQNQANAGINFYELKTQLADMGFNDPTVVDQLRNLILNRDLAFPTIFTNKLSGDHEVDFTLFLGPDGRGNYELHFFECSLTRLQEPGLRHLQYFQPDVSATDATALLRMGQPQFQASPDLFLPISKAFIQQQIHLQKTNSIMNTQNLDFLKKSLLNLGFGEQVNAELEKNMETKVPEFSLPAKHDFNQKAVDYTLHFKAGENQEMYFFNKFDATLQKGKEKELNQTFYITKGNGITAKEAFNLMEGRAVHKQLFNKDGEKYQAWLQLDNENLTKTGSKEIKRFGENYGFNLEEVISGKGIKELKNSESEENLMRSLKKGNLQQVTVERNGEEKKYFIAASPQYKTIDLYDHQLKKIKREELLQPEKKQVNNKKQGEQQKEDAPAKKQSKKNKMSV